MSPGSYTELFFLDEVTALAAGHRPCAECRHAEYRRFQTAWQRAFPRNSDARPAADMMDAVLHQERRVRPWLKRTHIAAFPSLPDGTFVAMDGRALLVRGTRLLAWAPDGYFQRVARPRSGDITVLTPESMVAVLRAGYEADVHPTAAD